MTRLEVAWSEAEFFVPLTDSLMETKSLANRWLAQHELRVDLENGQHVLRETDTSQVLAQSASLIDVITVAHEEIKRRSELQLTLV